MVSASMDVAKIVQGLLARAPEWIRVDLSSKDSGARSRAEETLAAMIAAAINKDRTPAVSADAILNATGEGK